MYIASMIGHNVSFTGTMPMERRECIKLVEACGGRGYETINTRCTLLVVGDKPGKGQQDKAKKWGTPCITWEQFARKIGLEQQKNPERRKTILRSIEENAREKEIATRTAAEKVRAGYTITLDEYAALVG